MEKSLNSYTLSDIRIITTINYSQRRGNEWRRSRISRPLSLLGVSLLTWPRPVAFALGLCTGRLLIGPLLSTLRFLLWLMVWSPIPFLPLVVVYSGSSHVSSPPSEFVPPPVFLSRHMNSYGLKKIFQSPIMFSLNPVSGKLFLHKMHVNNMI